jgi:hypothetical protein
VARVNKLFRETLLASSAKTVWIRALERAGAPKCPSDWKEPRWARLLFRTSCEVCISSLPRKGYVHFSFRIQGLWSEKHPKSRFLAETPCLYDLQEGKVSQFYFLLFPLLTLLTRNTS